MNFRWIQRLLVIMPVTAVVALTSCGSSPKPVSPPPSPTGFDESWHFDVSSTSLTLDTALTFSGNSIVGVAHLQSYASTPCPYGLPLSGTIDDQGHVSLQSPAETSVMLALDGTLSPDHASLSNGNYHFTGGCGGEQTGTLTGAKFEPLNGLYTGTLQIPYGNTVNVSAQLTQAAQSNSGGLFELSGTLTLSNGCDQTFNLTGASVVGAVVDLSSPSIGLDGLTGVMDSEAQQIELNDYIYSDDCIFGAHGIIARQ